MAFYGFKGDADNCYWTPYNYQTAEFGESDYNYKDYSFTSPPELNLNYSVYTFSEPNIQHYDPYPYSGNYSNPNFLQYDPPVDDRGFYFPSETNFRISYSVSEFNEPVFEEYDPTPYGGGYDIDAIYGKPLPPSDSICYPRSLPKSNGTALENFSYNSIPSPYGKDEEDDLPKKPPNGNIPIVKEAPVESADMIPTDDDESSDVVPGDGSDQNGFENGYEFERRIDQIPYGSGLESLDLCETLFGYWPCLAKIEQQQRAKSLESCDQDPWQSAADYLFGGPTMNGYGNYHHLQ